MVSLLCVAIAIPVAMCIKTGDPGTCQVLSFLEQCTLVCSS